MTERILAFFSYSETSPLIFTQLDFWLFFLIVFAGFALLNKKSELRNFYLMAVSWFFYYKTGGAFVSLLILSTISGFGLAYLIHNLEGKIARKFLLALSITVHLSLLAYFKYAFFIVSSFNDIFGTDIQVVNYFSLLANTITNKDTFNISNIVLPIGISFYTFQIITYVVDVYRKKLEPVESFFDFAFYVTFFPQLVAGPIVRASDFIPQLHKESNITKRDFGTALWMILKGLFKKVFIGDYIAVNFIDRVFDNPLSYTGVENISALFGYSLQVYCDFSGYTDIAIGLSLLMGFNLNMNFNSPYKAKNVGEFWKRWHISLSTFLKDYLYIPLGGNKHGSFRTNINLMLTMLLGGLWHGASWNFVLWGGINGVGLLVYKWWKKISPYEHKTDWLTHLWKVGITFVFITFTRIFFRSPDMQTVNDFFHQVFNNLGLDVMFKFIWSFKYVWAVIMLGYFTHWLSDTWKNKVLDWFIESHFALKVIITVVVITIIYQSVTSEMQPFIYFQF
jgi:alginate O-acetyltransferase complex protein AlgI